jgi:DNA-binding beta-propeller fold protein YncE
MRGCGRRSRAIAALVALVGLALGAAPAAAKWQHAKTWGSEGGGRGQFGSGRENIGGERQFDDPGGLVVDGRGHLQVADPSNNRIETSSLQGAYLGSIGSFGFARGPWDAAGRLDLPEGLALASGNSLAVSDNRNDRVQVLSTSGRSRAQMGGRGALPGQMVSPMGIAVRRGTIYVIDQGSYRIDRFSMRGAYRGAFGYFGKSGCGFVDPYGLAVSRQGTLYVADSGRRQVMEFTTRGRCVRSFGSAGSGPGHFSHPTGIAVDAGGNVLVADNYNASPPAGGAAGGCVQRFTASGRYLDSFGQGRLRSPTFLAAGPSGSVYVSDYRRVVSYVNGAGPGSDDPPCDSRGSGNPSGGGSGSGSCDDPSVCDPTLRADLGAGRRSPRR